MSVGGRGPPAEGIEMPTCQGRNGTYGCQRPSGHRGQHQATYTSAGVRKVATWSEPYGPVTHRKAQS